MPCFHVGPHGPGCDGWVDQAPAIEVTVNAWENIAKQFEVQLQMSMEQTRVAQENCRVAQKACEEALRLLNEHLKNCPSR